MPYHTVRVVIIYFLLHISFNLQGQVQLYYYDKPPKIDTTILRPMIESAIELENEYKAKRLKIGRLDVHEINDQVFAVARGRLDVFKWESGKWLNLYKGNFFGHNSYSKNFVFQNQIYSFGGYGFWRSHGQVIRFLFEEGDWELIPCTQELKYGLAYQVPEGLRLFGNDNLIIDLEKQIKIKYEPSFKQELYADRSNQKDIEFERFIYFAHDRPLLILDKQNHQMYESRLGSIGWTFYNPSNKRAFFHIYGDSLKIYNQRLDYLESYDIKKEIEEKYSPVPKSIFPSYSNINVSDLVMFILIIIVFGIAFLRKRDKKSIVYNKTIIQKILEWKDTQINMADLDILLDIHHIQNPDTLKFKRYQKIQEINRIYQSMHHKMLIVRIKDTADKRKYIYEIDK